MKYRKNMNYYRVRLRNCLLIGLSLLFFVRTVGYPGLHRKNIQVKSEHHFDRAIVRTELAMVMFYEKDKKLMKENKELESYVERLERMFTGMSKIPKYKEAGVYFMAVNLARRDLDTLVYEYPIGQLPTFMLFEDGAPLKKDGNPVVLVGDVSTEELRNFIDNHFNSRIEDIIADKAEARRQAAENRIYSGMYWGWGWPYSYWNSPYYGYYGPWWW